MKRTKGLFRLGMIALAVMFMALAGCTTAVSLIKNADQQTISSGNQSLLLITSLKYNLTITGFDNQQVKWYSRSWPLVYVNKVIVIPAGKHELSSKLSRSFTMKIEYDFLPGHYYNVEMENTAKTFQRATDDTTKLVVTDVTATVQAGGHYYKIFKNAKKQAHIPLD